MSKSIQNPYLNIKRAPGKALFDQDSYRKVVTIYPMCIFSVCANSEQNLYLNKKSAN